MPSVPGKPLRRGDLVGLVPAAGRATRLGPIACSKEILPLAARSHGARLPTGMDGLLDHFAASGVERVVILLRREKRDVRDWLAARPTDAIDVTCVDVPDTPSVPHTLDHAWPLVRDRRVALGFPDLLLDPRPVLPRLLARLSRRRPDVVLGLFPASDPRGCDMVRTERSGRVLELVIKRPERRLRYTWGVAVWTPEFTAFLHRFLEREEARWGESGGRELYVGDVLNAALASGLHVDSLRFPDGSCLDVGTPAGLAAAPGWLARRWRP